MKEHENVWLLYSEVHFGNLSMWVVLFDNKMIRLRFLAIIIIIIIIIICYHLGA